MNENECSIEKLESVFSPSGVFAIKKRRSSGVDWWTGEGWSLEKSSREQYPSEELATLATDEIPQEGWNLIVCEIPGEEI